MNRLPKFDLPGLDPYRIALWRLKLTLVVDAGVLRQLHRAARAGAPQAAATRFWALGIALADVSPETLTRAGDEALELAPDDPALALGVGLAHAVGYARRGLPLAARRAFDSLTTSDGDNLLAQLARAAARQSAGDRPAVARALSAAASAPTFRLLPSPVAEELDRAAPWLGWSLTLFWPERVGELVQQVVVGSLIAAARARAADSRRQALGRVEAVARRMLLLAADRPAELSLAGATLLHTLAARARLLADADAAALRERLAARGEQWLAARRALGRAFEQAVERQHSLAAGGVAGGLTIAGLGLVRRGRRWPPPLPLALAGRVLTGAGVAAALAAGASLYTPNPVAAEYRRRVERRLADRETALAATTAADWRALLDPLPPLVE